MSTATAINDIGSLRASFEIGLRARNRSPKTIRSYLEALDLYRNFAVESGFPTAVDQVNRDHVETFLADQLERWRPKTAQIRYGALRQFFKWAQEEGEVKTSPMVNMRPPTVPEVSVPVVSDADLAKLLKVCEGSGFDQRRDTAILRLFIDCGLRLAEVTNLSTADVDWDLQVVGVVGKGSRPRAVPMSPKTTQALDSYANRARKTHNQAVPPTPYGSELAARLPPMAWPRCFDDVVSRPVSNSSTPTSYATRPPTSP